MPPHTYIGEMNATSEFISTGGNRDPAAADWDEGGLQLLAFGADNSIALWDPQVSQPLHHATPPDSKRTQSSTVFDAC
jgi:hypothetical protein